MTSALSSFRRTLAPMPNFIGATFVVVGATSFMTDQPDGCLFSKGWVEAGRGRRPLAVYPTRSESGRQQSHSRPRSAFRLIAIAGTPVTEAERAGAVSPTGKRLNPRSRGSAPQDRLTPGASMLTALRSPK